MLGKFEDGQQYAFYVGLTDHILDLVRVIKKEQPQALNYCGMDFSHVFESLLYFGTVNDASLNDLYDVSVMGSPSGTNAPLTGDMAQFVARHWFGPEYVRNRKNAHGPIYAGLRRVARGLRWLTAASAPRASKAQENLPRRCDVLLYARSQRFTDYLAPIGRALPGRHAFLVPAGEHDVQRALSAAGKAFISTGTASPRFRPLDSLIGWYGAHLGYFADGVMEALERLHPGVILLAEGNSPDDEVINQVGRKLGIPTVALQQGWSPIVHPGFCNLSYETMMVWGDGFSELLAPSNPKQYFVSTGNYVLATHVDSAAIKRSGVLFFHQDIDRGLGGRRGTDMMIALAERIAEARTDVPISYRPHPLVPLEDHICARLLRWPNVTIQQTANVPLAEALGEACVSVSIYSSAILESIAARVIPIIFNMTSMPRYWPDVGAAGAGLEVRTTEDAFQALLKLLSGEEERASYLPAMAEFERRFFRARGEIAIRNIVVELGRVIGENKA
jgi:hypothetical protein